MPTCACGAQKVQPFNVKVIKRCILLLYLWEIIPVSLINFMHKIAIVHMQAANGHLIFRKINAQFSIPVCKNHGQQ